MVISGKDGGGAGHCAAPFSLASGTQDAAGTAPPVARSIMIAKSKLGRRLALPDASLETVACVVPIARAKSACRIPCSVRYCESFSMVGNIRDRNILVKHSYARPVFVFTASSDHTAAMNNIAKIRKSRGLNQTQLAELVGVSQPHISRIEKGDQGPPLSLFIQVAEALGVSLSDLFTSDLGAARRFLMDAFDSLPPNRQKAWVAMAELAQKEAALEASQTPTPLESK